RTPGARRQYICRRVGAFPEPRRPLPLLHQRTKSLFRSSEPSVGLSRDRPNAALDAQRSWQRLLRQPRRSRPREGNAAMTSRATVFVAAALLTTAVLCLASDSVPSPEMIGEGILSTPEDELGANLTADGETIYFERSIPPHYLYVLYESHLVGGKWSPPEVLPFSGQYRDTDPVLSPDGTTMLFASDRPVDGVDRHHFYIWQARKTAKGWSDAEILPGPVNDGFNQVFCSMARNGNLYFASSRKGGGYDMYRSRLVNGKYQEAEDLGPNLNDPSIWTFESTIAPDESYLLIGSFGRQPSYGSSDLYISYNQK